MMTVLLLPAIGRAGASEAEKKPANPKVSARVEWVVDGDTLDVRLEGKEEKIRLAHIDCPEMDQPFGLEAREYTFRLADGKKVRVETVEKDKFGRWVAQVFLPDGRNLSREIVKAGWAWWYRKYAPGDKTLKALEEEARKARRGIWSDAKPIPPWKWKAQRGEFTRPPPPRRPFGFKN